jgi:RNA polymerase sigma-70 factor (sigma-E family)
MSSSGSEDLVLGAPAEQETLGELFGTVFELAGEAAARLTPDEVNARLRRIAASAAHPADPAGAAAREWDADWAVAALYRDQYRSLVRLAALLVRDIATAEEVVQDSFVAMQGGWRRLRDTDKALAYLRQTVVNRSRAVLRHRAVVDRNAPKPAPDMPSAEHGALAMLERSAVVAALRTLPPRQREAVVLRYYGNLSEAQIAGAMGISQGAVKSHTARAMIALRAVLEREE